MASKERCDLMLTPRAKDELMRRSRGCHMSMSQYVESLLLGTCERPSEYGYSELSTMDARISELERWLTERFGFVDYRTLNPSLFEQMIG